MFWFKNTASFFKRFIEIIWFSLSLCFQRFFDTPEGKMRLTNPVRLRIFFERAGGCFIKFGQILALRQDFLPIEYVIELLKLLNRVPEASFEEIESVFAEETGKSIKTFFLKFNPQPIASASIGQVYEARLKNSPRGEADGTKVAVKIQRPHTIEFFEADFILISFLASIIDFFRIFSVIHAHEIVSDFISWTRKELDFTFEAQNGKVLYEHSADHPRTVIPGQYPELTTRRVLIQDFIEGEVLVDKIILGKVSKSDLLKKNIDVEELSCYLITDVMRQYFIDGFFHADPHPANLAFLPGNRLAYFDFGIVGEAGSQRLLFLKTLYGIAKKDLDYLCRHFLEFGKQVMEEELRLYLQVDIKKRQAYKKIFDKIKDLITEEFKEDIKKIMNPWFVAVENLNSSLYKKSAAVVFFRMIKEAEKYGVHLPREIILFLRSLLILDMVALQLSPKFDMIKALNIFFDKYPIEELERIIISGDHEEEVGKKLIPLTDVDWEFFRESAGMERERKIATREKLIDMIVFYAEKYEEVRSMLKTIR